MPPEHQARIAELARELSALAGGEFPELIEPLAKLIHRLRPCRPGPGFACLLWHGTLYHFTATQSKVIKVLYRAWKQGTPDVRWELLSEASGSDCGRLQDLFKEHPAWGNLVVSGLIKGTFRLKDHE